MKINKSLDDLEETVEEFLEEDAYYKVLETPLKSASSFKEQHRDQLREVFAFKEFQKTLQQGFDIIREVLPTRIGESEWNTILKEFEKVASMEETNEGEEIPQNSWGISATTMNHLYDLGKFLLDGKELEKSNAVFTVLCYLNPTVSTYFFGKGLSLFLSNEFEEARSLFQIQATLEPYKALPLIYVALCDFELQNRIQLKDDINAIEWILSQSQDEKNEYGKCLESIKSQYGG